MVLKSLKIRLPDTFCLIILQPDRLSTLLQSLLVILAQCICTILNKAASNLRVAQTNKGEQIIHIELLAQDKNKLIFMAGLLCRE